MTDLKKKSVGFAAIEFVEDGCSLGVGTGSTVDFFIESLAYANSKPGLIVSTSKRTDGLLKKYGLNTVSLLSIKKKLDVYVDGADEVDGKLNLIKGGGGALTSEKIVAASAKKFICIVDNTKIVERLGAFPLPIEIVPSARELIKNQLRKRFNGISRERVGFITEHGNSILDVFGLDIDDPITMPIEINTIPGVITVGLFTDQKPDVCLVGDNNGVRKIFKEEIT